jgi:hypothetical protein
MITLESLRLAFLIEQLPREIQLDSRLWDMIDDLSTTDDEDPSWASMLVWNWTKNELIDDYHQYCRCIRDGNKVPKWVILTGHRIPLTPFVVVVYHASNAIAIYDLRTATPAWILFLPVIISWRPFKIKRPRLF